jgi:thioredoxin-dependent peroxiredoxin
MHSNQAAMPTVGKSAPAFTLETDTGETLSLKDLKGKTVVLYFYPKDDTATCTTEACGFRDLMPRFKKGSAVILGVSPDSVKSHQKFKAKYDLPFTLLADTEHKLAEKYGVWKEKSMYGRKYMGVERTTFLIDATGKLRQVFDKVKAAGHAEEVAAAIAAL